MWPSPRSLHYALCVFALFSGPLWSNYQENDDDELMMMMMMIVMMMIMIMRRLTKLNGALITI